jgi:hypothetical protein
MPTTMPPIAPAAAAPPAMIGPRAFVVFVAAEPSVSVTEPTMPWLPFPALWRALLAPLRSLEPRERDRDCAAREFDGRDAADERDLDPDPDLARLPLAREERGFDSAMCDSSFRWLPP